MKDEAAASLQLCLYSVIWSSERERLSLLLYVVSPVQKDGTEIGAAADKRSTTTRVLEIEAQKLHCCV